MRVRITFATAAFVLIASVSAACAQTVPDRVLVGGSILTMDQADTVAQALALDGNRIMAVGSDAQVRALAGPKTQVIDLGGRTVIPGLIDTHIHALRAGQTYEFETYWHDTTSLADGLEQLKAAAIKRGPGKWVAVMGSWHPAQFVENREPTREDLTEALPDNPAYVQYLYEHATVNDKGIEALNLHDPASLPEGTRVERDRNGQPTGKIFGSISSFSALFEKITELEYDQRKNSLRNFFTELNRVGVTGVVDPAGGGSNAASYDPLFALWREKDLSVRVAYRVSAQTGGNEAAWFQSTLAYLPPRLGDEMLKFLGLGELLVFGVNDGVQMGPGFAPPQEAREELFRVSVFAAQRRYPVEIHAYTNDAAQAILEVFERVATVQPLEDLRWSITHINTGTQETFDRMKKLGLAYTVQMGPYFEAPMIKAANGAAVAETAPPIQLALNAGLMVAGGTDSTRIGVFNTWRALEYYVTGHAVGGTVRRRSDLLLSRLQALRLFTANAAWMTFDEDHRGSLETGKLADLVVLDRPYLAVPENEIHKLGSVLTLIDGIVVYASDEFAHLRGR